MQFCSTKYVFRSSRLLVNALTTFYQYVIDWANEEEHLALRSQSCEKAMLTYLTCLPGLSHHPCRKTRRVRAEVD